MLSNLSHPLELCPIWPGSVFIRSKHCYSQKDRNRFTKKRSEQVVGGTNGINEDDNSIKGQSKHEGYAAGSINSVEASNLKNTAASIPQDYSIPISYTLFDVKL